MIDFRNCRCRHGVIKADSRIFVKGYAIAPRRRGAPGLHRLIGAFHSPAKVALNQNTSRTANHQV